MCRGVYSLEALVEEGERLDRECKDAMCGIFEEGTDYSHDWMIHWKNQ